MVHSEEGESKLGLRWPLPLPKVLLVVELVEVAEARVLREASVGEWTSPAEPGIMLLLAELGIEEDGLLPSARRRWRCSLEPPTVGAGVLKLAEDSEGDTVLDEPREAAESFALLPPMRRLALLAIRRMRFHPEPERCCWVVPVDGR